MSSPTGVVFQGVFKSTTNMHQAAEQNDPGIIFKGSPIGGIGVCWQMAGKILE